MVQWGMLKDKAIELLGGTVTSAADAIGISYQAVDKWPADLPPRIEDRVLAAIARRHLTPEQLGTPNQEGVDTNSRHAATRQA